MATKRDGPQWIGRATESPMLSPLSASDQAERLRKLFAEIDARFRDEVRSDGMLRRISQTIEFSSEALFTSLVQIGLPPSVAIKLPSEIIPFLASANPSEPGKLLTTADIRIAVVQALQSLENDGQVSRETVSMWAAAYIRRYGNPSNQFVRVVDNGQEIDLNYDYIRRAVLPHLVSRILDLPKATDPFEKYGAVFSSTVLAGMSQAIIAAVNTLNLYSIRYKTLLNLLQDLVLEPPHPWMVSSQTIAKVVDYNLERARHHFTRLVAAEARGSPALGRQSGEECVRHAAAAILAHYGAFLGVGSRYGLVELRRMLGMRLSNCTLWAHCSFHRIEVDLRAMGSGVDILEAYVSRLQSCFATHNSDQSMLGSLRANAAVLLGIAGDLAASASSDPAVGVARRVEHVQVAVTVSPPLAAFSDTDERRLGSRLN